MIGFTFLKTRKPKQFDYRPRYFDPEQEERDARKKAILGANYKEYYKSEAEKNGSEPEYKPGQYVNDMRLRRGIIADRRSSQKRTATTRVIIFLGILLLIGAWLVYTTIF